MIGPPLYSEIRCFHAGNQLPVFETAHGTIGVLICDEFSLAPELSRTLDTVTCNRVRRERTREYYGRSTIDLAALDAWDQRKFDPRSNPAWELIARKYAQLAARTPALR